MIYIFEAAAAAVVVVVNPWRINCKTWDSDEMEHIYIYIIGQSLIK